MARLELSEPRWARRNVFPIANLHVPIHAACRKIFANTTRENRVRSSRLDYSLSPFSQIIHDCSFENTSLPQPWPVVRFTFTQIGLPAPLLPSLITLQSLIETITRHGVQVHGSLARLHGIILHISFHALDTAIPNPSDQKGVVGLRVLVKDGKEAAVEVNILRCGCQPLGSFFNCLTRER